MVMLQRRSVKWREDGHVTEVVTLTEEKWSCYRGRENGYITELASLMEGEWSCYRSGHFKEGKMVVTQIASLMQAEWSC